MAINGSGTGAPNKLALAAGFGIGVLWVAMALWCLVAGVNGFSDERPDYGLAWTLVGVLLLAAGSAALIGTWWHQFVLKRRYAQHQH
ncbi:MAG: hypothetical protein ACT443_11235 [Gemmatimonadota bacterium]